MFTEELFYSVHNSGDGSAYPVLFESEELAELDQEMMDEGWGECCNGSFTVESESPITITSDLTTAQDMITELEDELEYYSENHRKAANIKEKIEKIKEIIGEKVIPKTEVQEMFSMALLTGKIKHYKKFGFVSVRIAKEGEVVKTIIGDKLETVNTASVNDVVITNPTGEKYIISKKKLLERYMYSTHDLWESKGDCFGFVYSGNGFSFEAPWGEQMIVEDNDLIVISAISDPDDIYRIERNAFDSCYKEV